MKIIQNLMVNKDVLVLPLSQSRILPIVFIYSKIFSLKLVVASDCERISPKLAELSKSFDKPFSLSKLESLQTAQV